MFVCVDRCIISHLSQLNRHLISMSSHSLKQKERQFLRNCAFPPHFSVIQHFNAETNIQGSRLHRYQHEIIWQKTSICMISIFIQFHFILDDFLNQFRHKSVIESYSNSNHQQHICRPHIYKTTQKQHQ